MGELWVPDAVFLSRLGEIALPILRKTRRQVEVSAAKLRPSADFRRRIAANSRGA